VGAGEPKGLNRIAKIGSVRSSMPDGGEP